MGDDVQTVAECNTQNDGTYAQSHERHTALDEEHHGQSEASTVAHWEDECGDGGFVFKAETNDNAYQEERYGERKAKIFLNLTAIVDTLNGRTVKEYFEVGMLCLEQINLLLDELN